MQKRRDIISHAPACQTWRMYEGVCRLSYTSAGTFEAILGRTISQPMIAHGSFSPSKQLMTNNSQPILVEPQSKHLSVLKNNVQIYV